MTWNFLFFFRTFDLGPKAFWRLDFFRLGRRFVGVVDAVLKSWRIKIYYQLTHNYYALMLIMNIIYQDICFTWHRLSFARFVLAGLWHAFSRIGVFDNCFGGLRLRDDWLMTCAKFVVSRFHEVLAGVSSIRSRSAKDCLKSEKTICRTKIIVTSHRISQYFE